MMRTLRWVQVSAILFVTIDLVASLGHANSHIEEKTHHRSLQIKDQPPCREPDPELTYFCPMSRYCEWDYYHPNTRQFLRTSLDYTRRRWNYMDQVNEEIELTSFDELDANQTMVLELLGFDEASHDCCHGHYTAYDWDDFDGDLSGVKAAWELLGYNQQLWDGGASTAAEDLDWDELPSEVRIALRSNLCYSKEIWDGVDISSWSDGVVLPGTFMEKGREVVFVTGSPTEAPTTASPTSFTKKPTMTPSVVVSMTPSISSLPSVVTSTSPTVETSMSPSVVLSSTPTFEKSEAPSLKPSMEFPPSLFPTNLPTSVIRTSFPTQVKSSNPSVMISSIPTELKTKEPTMKPTSKPTSDPTSDPTSKPTPDGMFFDACHKLDPRNEYFCPVKRYCDWNYYDFTARQFLRFQIGYDRPTWNYYSIHDIENTAFEDLTEFERTGLTIFAGYDEDSHDCCQGHYGSYDWAEFESDESYADVLNALTLLEYNQAIWDGGMSTKYDNFEWDQLPLEIQNAISEGLCYTKETWNQQPLDTWSKDTILPGQSEKKQRKTPSPTPVITSSPTSQDRTSSPTFAPCRELNPSVDYWCPAKRYCEWDYFDFASRQVFTFQIGYTESDWNYEETVNIVEATAFEDLEKFVKSGLRDLGFTEDKHDCCHNHYTAYAWDEFISEGMDDVLAAYEMIGYDKDKWDSGASTDFEEFDWDQLPREIRDALSKSLCYNRELWNEVPLTVWPENVILPGSSGEGLHESKIEESSEDTQSTIPSSTTSSSSPPRLQPVPWQIAVVVVFFSVVTLLS